MTNIYSYEYRENSSKVGTFFGALGVTIAVMVGQIGLVILFMIVKMIQTAVTAPNGKAFSAAMNGRSHGSAF